MRQIKLLQIATSMLFCIAICGCAHSDSRIAMPNAALSSATDLVRPATPIELITNLKAALDANMLVRDDTYSEDSLKTLTGGNDFRWDSDSRMLKMVYISNFPASYSKPGTLAPHKIYCSFQRLDGYDQGQIIIEDLIRSVPLSELLHLFGNSYAVGNAHAGEREDPIPLDPQTNANGNKVFDYEFSHLDVTTNIRVTSAGDGSVETISMTQRGKK